MRDFSIETLRSQLRAKVTGSQEYTPRIDRALELSFHAHQSQVREHRAEDTPAIPYITHPVGVAVLASELWVEGELDDTFEDMVCAALTHDVLEDSETDSGELQRQTSRRCAELVLALTKPLVDRDVSRSERNRLFVEQIRQAGSTARYLKLCDAAHNLDRPSAMPATLLAKTVQKVVKFYLPMAVGERFESRLSELLESRVDAARACEHFQSTQPAKFAGIALDAFLEICEKCASGKVFEEHDMESLLLRVPGVLGVTTVPIDEFLDTWLSASDETTRQRYASLAAGSATSSSELAVGTVTPTALSVLPAGTDVILFTSLFGHTGEASLPFVHCAIDKSIAPAWLTASVFNAVTSVLSTRLRARKARETSDIAIALMRYELDLDPSIALRHHMDRRRIADLKQFLDRGRFVEHGLYRFVQDQLIEASLDEAHAVLISRTKSPESLLRKIAERKLIHTAEVDDAVGLRAVFISQSVRNRFVTSLTRALANVLRENRLPVAIDAQSLSQEQVSSSAGYRAVHVRFRTRPEQGYESLGVEIQLRTVQEDAWARVSQYAVYNTDSNRNAKRTGRHLRRLADLRDEIEQEILQLG